MLKVSVKDSATAGADIGRRFAAKLSIPVALEVNKLTKRL